MALLSCPECGGMVSDQAKICIHCGYPLTPIETADGFYLIEIVKCNQFQKLPANFGPLLGLFPEAAKKYIETRSPKLPFYLGTGLTYENAKWFEHEAKRARFVVECKPDPKCLKSNKSVNTFINDERRGLKHCPRCKQTTVSTGKRGFRLTTGFIGANKVMNYCSNCGYKWYPN